MSDMLVHGQLMIVNEHLIETNELLEAIRLEMKRSRLESERQTNAVRQLSADLARRSR